MNFRKCTDDLLIRITLDDVAKALDLSVQTIRQARVSSASSPTDTPRMDGRSLSGFWLRGELTN